MTLNAALAAAATLVALAFSISTFDRWLQRRRPHDGAWSFSLLLFAVGSLALWWAEARGWSLSSFRVFFLAGAVLNVPWLALGTVYLLFGIKIGKIVKTWLIGLSGAAVGVMLVAPTKHDQLTGTDMSGGALPQGSEIFGVAPRIFAAVGSGVAALLIIGGAMWSIIRVLRGRLPAVGQAQQQITNTRRHVASNTLIAVGTIILSASGTLAGRLGEDRAFALTLLLGIVVLFAGFLVSASRPDGSWRKLVDLQTQEG